MDESKIYPKIVFLDYKKYPNSDLALEILRENHEVLVPELDELNLDEGINSVIYYTIIPGMEKTLLENGVTQLYFDVTEKETIDLIKSFTKLEFSDLLIPKLKLNSQDIDPLELSKLYELSPSLSVKIQTNGLPMINKYEGLSSFLEINKLNSGIVTPATNQECEVIAGEVETYFNYDFVLQVIDSGYQLIKVIKFTRNNLIWYDTKIVDLPDKFISYLKVLDEFVIQETSKETNKYYIFLKDLKVFKISTIFPGINYHVDPRSYLKQAHPSG